MLFMTSNDILCEIPDLISLVLFNNFPKFPTVSYDLLFYNEAKNNTPVFR